MRIARSLQDGPWSVNVVAMPHEPTSYSLHIITTTHRITLTRTVKEIVDLDRRLRETCLDAKVPSFPTGIQSSLPHPLKRMSSLLNALSRLATPISRGTSRRSSNASTVSSNVSSGGNAGPHDDTESPSAKAANLTSYFNMIANSRSLRQAPVLMHFFRARTDDLEFPRVERAVKRVRSDFTMYTGGLDEEKETVYQSSRRASIAPSETGISLEEDSISDWREQIRDLVTALEEIFANQEKYKRLLSCHVLSAQRLLDMFQRLLDLLDAPPPGFRSDLIVAAQRLAGKSGLYPICFELKDVTAVGDVCVSYGAFADIYKGIFRDRSVCLKTMRLDQRTDIQQFLKVCSKEAILWGQLSHPNLLPFYGIYRFRNRISLVSPWMKHGDITNYLRERPSANRVLLASDVAHGLHFLHENQIIHGDLKGPNILVNELERACVADFGLSSISNREILAWTSQPSVASKGGSVRWQAPELFDPESDEDVLNTVFSDVYAWACVAYEIFAGQVPFSHLSRDTAVTLKVRDGERPARPEDSSASWTAWGLTEDVWTLVEDGWKADPASRPTVEQIIERLDVEMRKRPPESSGAHVSFGGDSYALSPARFREMARLKPDVEDVSVLTLEMLLNAK